MLGCSVTHKQNTMDEREQKVEISTEAAIIGNNVLPAVDYSDRYRNIKTKEDYTSLLKSGLFWEFHPELTGVWSEDKILMQVEEQKKMMAKSTNKHQITP